MQKDQSADNNYENSVPFSALCQLFEKATKAKKHAKKKELLQTFFKHYENDSYFAVMRLLLPQVTSSWFHALPNVATTLA